MYRGGATALEAATHFGVCSRSVYRWDKLEKKQGAVSSGHVRSGRKSKIVVDEKFEKFAKATATRTLQAMADYWNGQAEKHVSQMAMCRAVKKLGYTRKKRRTATKKPAQKSKRSS